MTDIIGDIAEWLDRIGLQQYAQVFTQQHIDYSVLPDLTESDLETLGLSLGHRKKLLKAIAALRAPNQTADTPETPHTGANSIPLAQQREPELRHITVVFCDLVGSTHLATMMDPEDLQTLTETYRRTCGTAINRYGGEVARYFGDGVMAFFGWPRAHEDDAHRAVHAALDIVAAVTTISGPVPLACRVGVCSGSVVVGERGEGNTSLMDAVGETPNIAARLQNLAAINTVLISESTRRLISAAFDVQDLGRHEVKGIGEPLRVYRVHAANNAGRRFDAARAESLTPLVGRSTELNLLLDRWEKVKAGDGQGVLISGVAGIGKSRLLHELKSHIQREQHHLLYYQCSSYHSQTAFFPVIEQIEQAAQLDPHDTDLEKAAKLQTYLPPSALISAETPLLLTNLLSITTEAADTLSDLTPQQIKNKTINALVDVLMAFSLQRQTVCIFEDAHWLDPSTLEFLELVINRLGHGRLLVIVSCRPEFRPAWTTHPNITSHSLARLSHGEVKTLIHGLLRGESIPQQLIAQIIEKADGLPLFIEELTSSTLVSSTRNRNAFEHTPQPASLRVPETLSDAFMERLDRAAPSRRLAQIAAVIGREFSYDLLAAVAQVNAGDMQSSLSLLEEADIVHRVGVFPVVRFSFKHVLLRDAVYDSLLRSTRQQIHATIADTLERDFPDVIENQTEVLAYHYQEAAKHDSAIHYWIDSGNRAVAHSANVEAIANYRNALRILQTLPETTERNRQESAIQLALGIPLIAVQGYASDESREAFSRARALCLQLGDAPEYLQALFGLWGHSWMGGKNDDALRMAEEFSERSRAMPDPGLPMVAHRVMGSTLLTAGDFRSSAAHFEEAVRLSAHDGQEILYNRYMVEPNAASLLLLSWDLWFLGYADQSVSRVSQALALADELGHPYTVAFAHYIASVVHLLRGDAQRALESAERSMTVSQEQRFSLYVTLARLSRGRALGDLDQVHEARAEIELGLDEARHSGVRFMLAMMEGWQADVLGKVGDHDRALSIVEACLANSNDATGRAWEAELHRQKAQILLTQNRSNGEEAEDCFKRSIEVARAQSAKALELRAASGLAELWRTQGRHEDARNLLEPICRWFAEGTETADLKLAREIQAVLH